MKHPSCLCRRTLNPSKCFFFLLKGTNLLEVVVIPVQSTRYTLICFRYNIRETSSTKYPYQARYIYVLFLKCGGHAARLSERARRHESLELFDRQAILRRYFPSRGLGWGGQDEQGLIDCLQYNNAVWPSTLKFQRFGQEESCEQRVRAANERPPYYRCQNVCCLQDAA